MPIKVVTRLPKKLAKKFWPGKVGVTVSQAVKWFYKRYQVYPLYAEVEDRDRNALQQVRMYHPKVKSST